MSSGERQPVINTESAGRSRQKSRVSNGSAALPATDGRSVWVRRFRDLVTAHVNDLGGPAVVSEAERSICRRAAGLTVEIEQMESRFATAGGAELEELEVYQRTANSLRRLLESIGLKRRPVDVNPSGGRWERGGTWDLSKLTDEELAAYKLLSTKAAESTQEPLIMLPDNGRGGPVGRIERVIVYPGMTLHQAADAYAETLKDDGNQQ